MRPGRQGPLAQQGRWDRRVLRELMAFQGPVGQAGPQGERGLPGVTSAPGLRVVDSLGQDVGGYVYEGGVVFSLPAGQVLLQIRPAGFPEYGNSYYFESSDCSGTPYGFDNSNGNFTSYAYVARSKAVWASGPFRTVVTHSYRLFFPSTETNATDGVCQVGTNTAPMAPAVTLDLSTLNLVPPFRVD